LAWSLKHLIQSTAGCALSDVHREFPRTAELGAMFIGRVDVALAIVTGRVCHHVADNVSFAVAVQQVLGTRVEGKKTNLKRLSRSDPVEYVASFYIAGLETWLGWSFGWPRAAAC
jgi:hypothetical protein